MSRDRFLILNVMVCPRQPIQNISMSMCIYIEPMLYSSMLLFWPDRLQNVHLFASTYKCNVVNRHALHLRERRKYAVFYLKHKQVYATLRIIEYAYYSKYLLYSLSSNDYVDKCTIYLRNSRLLQYFHFYSVPLCQRFKSRYIHAITIHICSHMAIMYKYITPASRIRTTYIITYPLCTNSLLRQPGFEAGT